MIRALLVAFPGQGEQTNISVQLQAWSIDHRTEQELQEGLRSNGSVYWQLPPSAHG